MTVAFGGLQLFLFLLGVLAYIIIAARVTRFYEVHSRIPVHSVEDFTSILLGVGWPVAVPGTFVFLLVRKIVRLSYGSPLPPPGKRY